MWHKYTKVAFFVHLTVFAKVLDDSQAKLQLRMTISTFYSNFLFISALILDSIALVIILRPPRLVAENKSWRFLEKKIANGSIPSNKQNLHLMANLLKNTHRKKRLQMVPFLQINGMPI